MERKRKLAVAIVSGIPAIVGSGLVWEAGQSWPLVFAYLALLGVALLVFAIKL